MCAQNDVDLREANERRQQNFTVATRKSCKKTPQISCGHESCLKIGTIDFPNQIYLIQQHLV